MSTPLNLKIDPEKVHEIPMVDLAFMVLKTANTPYYYRDLMNEVARLRGMSEEDINQAIAQLYTEINIDGRFACVGTNLWGLKRWYPVDRSEDPVSNAKRPRIINDDDDDDNDLEDFVDEEEETYSGDDEDYTALDEDSDDDELFSDEDDDAEVDEELIGDEEIEDEDLNEEDESSEDEDFKHDEEED